MKNENMYVLAISLEFASLKLDMTFVTIFCMSS